MLPKFVKTSNVTRFLAAVTQTEQRGAREAGWIACIGEPGLGKTRTLEWWAIQRQAVFLRAKSEWTAHWVLMELAQGLGLSADGTKRQLFARVLQAVGETGKPIVLDEAEKTRHNPRLIETIRDISDLTEVEVVIGGTSDALRYITKFPQMSSRVSATARFALATLDDVKAMAEQTCEVPIAADLLAELHRQSNGYFREIKNGLREIERIGLVNKGTAVTLEAMAGRELCRNRRALESGAGRR
jgi:DNA transposition AAA+ family ATPase